MHYITLDYQTNYVRKRHGYLSCDLWAWPMGPCDLIGHVHRSHGTPTQRPLAATTSLLSPKLHIYSLI